MERDFEIWDVFTDRPLRGNPLAVVYGLSGLSDADMQAIAAEFNLSETIFLADGAADPVDARIFTPMHELPFAGHPSVGGSLALSRWRGGGDVALALKAGVVACAIAKGRARFDAPKLPVVEGPADRDGIAAVLALPTSAIGASDLQPAHVLSGGPRFTMAPLADVAALQALRPDSGGFQTHLAEGYAALYAFAREGEHAFRARMFAPTLGVAEDPATGSAAVALAACLAPTLADGTHELSIRQGVEMGRPSDIALIVECEGGKLVRAAIEGGAVRVAEGRLLVP